VLIVADTDYQIVAVLSALLENIQMSNVKEVKAAKYESDLHKFL
jgi:hypothetical protein